MHILVVDDHPIFLSGVEFLLASHYPDADVQVLSNAHEALAHLARQPTDLLILDVNLPNMSGIDMLKTMTDRGLAVATLVMSAEVQSQQVIGSLQAGALGFIPKSFDPADMVTAIEQVMSGQVYLPQALAAEINGASQSKSHCNIERAREHGITPRQSAVLDLVAQGFSNKQIASELNLTEYTVKSHVRALFAALDCRNRTSCVRRAQALGIVDTASAGI